MASPNDPNTPSTPTITQWPATLSPYTPTNEVVVTQMPVIRRNNSSFITPRARHSQVIDADDDPSFDLNSYGNDDNPVQSPMANASTVAVTVTQTQSSPDLNMRSAVDTLLLLNTSNDKKGKKQVAMKDIKQTTSKVRRVTHPIENKLLTFLRLPYILPTSTNPFGNFGATYKSANNHWQNERSEKWKPFKSVVLKKELKHSPQALSIFHNRLLLEDIMLLKKNDSVIMLLSMNHSFWKDQRHSTTWKKRLLDSWLIQPFQPVQSKRRCIIVSN